MSPLPRKFPVVAGAVLLLAAAVLPWAMNQPSPVPRVDGRPIGSAPAAKVAPRPAADSRFPAPVLNPHDTGTEEHRDWLRTRGEELLDLSWMEDEASLRIILGELANPDPEIRAAALTATIAFGSRDAIPRLEALAAASGDPVEQKKLEEAAAHLKLPTLSEVMAIRKSRSDD
jgi:hypothetical protein